MLVGVTIIEAPFPEEAPPQLPVYHCHVEPSEPSVPDTESEEENPLQIIVGEALTEPAIVELSTTVTEILTQFVVLQSPSALTKYVSFAKVLTVGETPKVT